MHAPVSTPIVPRGRPPAVRWALWLALGAALACSSSSEPANGSPLALIDDVQRVLRGDTVVLDGSSSYDPDGDSLTYTWSLTSTPIGSVAELGPSTSPDPAFVADSVGSYAVELTVSDGHASSPVRSKTIPVVVPPPTVSIAAPADEDVVGISPVTVTGTVDDPSAIVQVNGVAATVNPATGAFTATVPLVAGDNDIAVSAGNSTGLGAKTISVNYNTSSGPVVRIAAPKTNTVYGKVYHTGGTVILPTDTVRGTIQVYTTSTPNTPTVTIGGVAATIADTTFSGCPTGGQQRCFKFKLGVSLPRGRDTLTALGRDVLARTASASVQVVSEVAYRPEDAEWQGEQQTVSPVAWSGPTPRAKAVIQTDPAHPIQNNRAHQMDGCSAPDAYTNRNDPMHGNKTARDSTRFGFGTTPPTEYFVHGQKPATNLPCSNHDVCYQTAGSSRTKCDSTFYDEMRAVCAKAYPGETIGYYYLHPAYKEERDKCYQWASTYYNAVSTVSHALKFDRRQSEYTY